MSMTCLGILNSLRFPLLASLFGSRPADHDTCAVALEILSLRGISPMTYRLPSLNALRAFEASGRHLSFRHAATELCVTAGAVSQQVKGLETTMGVSLFRRLPRGLVLTPEGEAYLVPISDAFKRISRATDDVSATLRARDFRLGLAADIDGQVEGFFSGLLDQKTNGHVAVVVRNSSIEDVLDGRVDAFLRSSIQSVAGLHTDQLAIPNLDGADIAVTLVLRPGIVGCREHALFLNVVGKA